MEHYRRINTKDVPCLQRLIDELMKDAPNFVVVKASMKEMGLTYSADPIECMNVVLKALHPEPLAPEQGGSPA